MAGDYRTILLDDFTGGLNLRETATLLQPNESPDLWNVSITEHGAIESRLGYSKWNDTSQPSALISIGYFSRALQKTLWQAGTSLYAQTTDGAFSSIKTFTTSARCAMVDFLGSVYVVHPVDGLFSYNGTTFSAAIANGPAGDTIAVWQNKLWIAGNTTNKTRVYWGGAGGSDFTATGSGTNDIRVLNDEPVEALCPSPREGLLVYKRESVYRVTDSTTGSYMTVDTNFGAVNHQAVTTMNGVVYALNQHGVYITDGLTEVKEASDKIQALWLPFQLNFDESDRWCCGYRDPKLYFSMTSGIETANDLALELDTRFGSWTVHSCAVSTYVMYHPDEDEKLLGGSPSVNGQAYEMYDDTGTDDGADIVSRFQGAFQHPDRYSQKRFRRAVIRGRGVFFLYVHLDGSPETDDVWTIDNTSAVPAVWDDGFLYDAEDSIWGPSFVEGTQEIFSLGRARDISFEVRATTDEASSLLQTLDTLGVPTVGYWGLYAIRLDYVDLGLA